jgi:protein O-mannosyl-transferase
MKTAQKTRKPRQRVRPDAGAQPMFAAWAAGLLLLVLVVVAYVPAMRADYVWDDDQYVQDQDVSAPGGLWRIWFDLKSSPQYYPLVYSSYWLEYRIWGDNPAGYHVVNILLHGVVVILLWRFLRRLELPAAWAAAAIFALHPVHAESVAWITERKNVLSGIFYFAAALAYLRFEGLSPQPATDRRWAWWAAALALFAASLLSKTVTCTLPAVLLLILWWKHGRIALKDALPLAPFFVLGVTVGLFTSWFEKHYTGALGEQWSMTLLERCLVAGRVPWFYIGKLLWPANLTFIYPRWRIDAHAWSQYAYPLAAIAALLTLLLLRRRIGWGPLVAALCFVGTLFPVLGFFNVYYMQYSFVADHWVYLASIAIIVLVCVGAQRLASRGPASLKRAMPMVAAVVIAALGVLTWQQCRIYSDLEGLWRDVLRKNPGAVMAYINLGYLLQNQGRLDEAFDAYQRAIELQPDYAKAHGNLGIVYRKQGRLDDAIRQYRRAIECDPDYADAHFNLGLALQDRGDLDHTVAEFRKCIDLSPRNFRAHFRLACILMGRDQLEPAAEHFEAALAINPYLAEAHINLARIRGDQDRFAEALTHCSRALEINPGDADTLALREQLLALQGRRP